MKLLILLAEIKFFYFLKKLSYYENLYLIQYNYCGFHKDNIVLLKYKALYFTYPREKCDFSHIYRLVLLFIAHSRKYNQILTLLNNNRWLDDNSTKFRRLLKQCNVFYLQFCLLGLLARTPAITKPRGFSAQ